MGYYSDVAFVIKDVKVNDFFNELKHNTEEYFISSNHPEESIQTVKHIINDYFLDTISYSEPNNKGDILVYIEFVKWKESDIPEKLIIKSLINIGFENFKFIKLGEELKDIEELGEYYSEAFDLNWSRNITLKEDITDYPIYNFEVFKD